jgi:hypothetical protein
VRAWNGHGIAGSTHAGPQHGRSRGGGSANTNTNTNNKPPSLLAAVVRVDRLLNLRAQEIAAAANADAADAPDNNSVEMGVEEDDSATAPAAIADVVPAPQPSSAGSKRKAPEGASATPAAEAAANATSAEAAAAAAPPTGAADAQAALLASHPSLRIRHARLLADIMTRKQRGVDALASAALGTWY